MYLGLGTGYSSSPDATGKYKAGNYDYWIGYYDSYYLNPLAGWESTLNNDLSYFVELNYSLYLWTRYNLAGADIENNSRKFAQLVFVITGIKF